MAVAPYTGRFGPPLAYLFAGKYPPNEPGRKVYGAFPLITDLTSPKPRDILEL